MKTPEIGILVSTMEIEVLFVHTGLTQDRTGARRLIARGKCRVDGVKITNPHKVVEPRTGMVVQAGRRAVKLVMR